MSQVGFSSLTASQGRADFPTLLFQIRPCNDYEDPSPFSVFVSLPCGQFVDRILSTRPITNGKEWERIVKTLEIPWWLQLSKRQILTFLPRLRFGTVRSEVRILSPRPVKSDTYGYPQRWPFLFLAVLCQTRSFAFFECLTASTSPLIGTE